MAQTGYTPILIYSSSTTTNAPAVGNLTNSALGSELAINITDGKLFYKDNANAIQVIGWKVVPATAGGTGQTSYAVGDLLYADTTTTLAKLADVATGNALISGGVGVAPAWGKIGLTTHVSGTLGVANGGTGTGTAFTAGSVVFAGASGVYSQDNANIFWDDTNNRLGLGINTPSYILQAFGTAPIIASGGTTYLGSSSTIGASFVLRSENTASWTGTRELISFDSVGNGADHRTGTLSVKLKAASGDSTLTEYLQLNPTFGYSNFPSGDLKIGTGNLLVNFTSGSNHYIAKAVAEGADILGVISTTTNLQTAYFMGVSSAGENAAASAIGVRKNSSTSRSINAAGTINASGADYAEYMTKAGNFTVAKGDVVGVDAQGKLTNVFADAISFVVKSTDPSYVGGDVWGNEETLGLTKPQVPFQREATEEINAETDEEFAIRNAQYESDKQAFEIALETARQRVDRIAFAGQVPVNVTNAIAGQYIIPLNDDGAIKGEAVSNPTFEQYQIAVGKVISIEPDGRAKIIVKVA